jgi:two-component sensor histidine kinase
MPSSLEYSPPSRVSRSVSPDVANTPAKGGLGTTLVKALAQDLDAEVEVLSGPGGVNVSLTHAAFPSRLP